MLRKIENESGFLSKTRLLLLLCFISILASSCVNFQQMIYMQEENPDAGMAVRQGQHYDNQPLRDYHIQPNDNLLIKVDNYEGSSFQLFNGENTGSNNLNGGSGINAAIYLNSYSVSKEGNIVLPLIGEMTVEGLTTTEIKNRLDSLLMPHLPLGSSSVKLVNFRITVLGEVNNPGLHYIYNDYGTLYEALGLAGDLKTYANREQIKIVRETGEGLQTAYLDLTRPEILASPYYYLRPNDIIYVEPIKAWAFRNNANTVSIIISAISVVTLIANVIVNSRS